MTWVLEGAALLCLIYYGVIAVYAGVSTSFALFWPVTAAVLALLGLGVYINSHHPGRIPVWLSVSVGTFFGACFFIFVITEALIGWNALTAKGRAADYVIVLGARVRGTEPSNSLRLRLDRAIEYAEQYPNTVLVLSGGRGEGEEISEARAMYDYLRYNDVPAEKLLIEDQSSDTVENIAFSKTVIERQEYNKAQAAQAHLLDSYHARGEGDLLRIAILTSDYHLFRAKAIARKEGIIELTGVPARDDTVLALHMWVREAFAVLKDKFMGRM